MQLKRYSSKEPVVFIWVMLPYVLGMNLLLFGTCILTSFSQFILSSLYSGIYLFSVYAVFGTVAVAIKKQFPAAGDLFRRIAIMLPVFYLLNIGVIKAMIFLYQHINLLACQPNESMEWWCILYGCIVSTAITFLNEGMANFEVWKASINETEKLKNIYQRSKLLGLKGQINPHFLFNCFNTLSGLIQEGEDKAESFLDEMTKVHRYLLRSDDDMFVPVEEEIKFAGSYLYLTKERFGKGVEYQINIPEKAKAFLLPPLSLQVVLENIIYSNVISKSDPLQIRIGVNEEGLVIQHSVLEKKIVETLEEDGLENLINKYELLKVGQIDITTQNNQRTIILPLIRDSNAAYGNRQA